MKLWQPEAGTPQGRLSVRCFPTSILTLWTI